MNLIDKLALSFALSGVALVCAARVSVEFRRLETLTGVLAKSAVISVIGLIVTCFLTIWL